jgi:isobutyryl-CoA mutase
VGCYRIAQEIPPKIPIFAPNKTQIMSQTMSQIAIPYVPKHKIRIVTAASLFDGHDAAINIMRRIMQASGAEIIHLGHNRSVAEIVYTAIQEDVQGIAITSYQGGHIEFFKYAYDLLRQNNAAHIKIFGGGGGTILPDEIAELQAYGITRLYSPDDGRSMGLQGMINDVLQQCDFAVGEKLNGEVKHLNEGNFGAVARLISAVENYPEASETWLKDLTKNIENQPITPVLGITGTGGAGKSSLVDELVRRFLNATDRGKRIAILSVDPSKRKTGGALLGDRIRMNALNITGATERVYMRSLATRQSNLALSKHVQSAVNILKNANFDLIILETSGIGQSDTEIVDHSDLSLYVMTPEYGAATQLEKIDMLDFADLITLNKFDKRGALDALRDVKKQYQRNHNRWDDDLDAMPVFGTMASQFNDPGMNALYVAVVDLIKNRTGVDLFTSSPPTPQRGALHVHSADIAEQNTLATDVKKPPFGGLGGLTLPEKTYIIPPARTRYLSEICETIRQYNQRTDAQADLARKWQTLRQAAALVPESAAMLEKAAAEVELQLEGTNRLTLETWQAKRAQYAADEYIYQVRGKDIRVPTFKMTLSGTRLQRVSLPTYNDYGDILRWIKQENVPGEFPYTAGVFPFKRAGEDPTRMFAGEGAPERTNRRFHYVSQGQAAKRLSTAFDSVTLYGEDPDLRPDIYGKVGNSGVSVCCLDDAKKLYSGFDLCDPATSVSMTINGPAATVCAFFMNAAIDQRCEKYIRENHLLHLVEKRLQEKYPNGNAPKYRGELPEGNNGLGLLLLGITGDEVLEKNTYQQLKAEALSAVRGTVQADILKEDQAQNTCIFSTEFSLKLMGDVQQYFINHRVRNFYSVSISGYHIAEAGANPISQLAFTLSNGFTFVEYYLSRGMAIDDFAPNLSFFFSNGIDAEYAVIGRVARRIWAKAMRLKYGANERSQQLKYHIQTSGRSLHAQEIAFNDIRTTLQALYAIYDNCNSLHTNAYDEAITTPTEESVRRAMAIQLIINHELGLAKNENPMQGSFITEELTDLVEAAVLLEFDRITERGGVLGAMETMYQRGKIQEESMHYEMQKHTGELPIVGVNFFKDPDGSPTVLPREVIRATEAEKQAQIQTLAQLKSVDPTQAAQQLQQLQAVAVANGNLFDTLMETVKYCSLGEITHALYAVGGQYRRNM